MKNHLNIVANSKWKLAIVLTALFLGALVVRWIAILQTPVIANDAILYIKAAKLYFNGAYHDALLVCSFSILPLLISYSYKIIGDWVIAGQLVSTICGALTVIPLYLLARRIFDGRVALYGAIFYILCPNLVQYSAEVLRDTPFIFFYITALWLAYLGFKSETKKGWYLFFACIFIVVSTLIRREGALLLIVFFSFAIWIGVKEKKAWIKTTFLLIFFLFLLCSVLYIARVLSPKVMGVSFKIAETVEGELQFSLTGSKITEIEKEVEEKNISRYGRNLFQLAKEHRFILYISQIIYKSIKVFTIPLFVFFLFGIVKRKKLEYKASELLLILIYGVFIIAFLFHLNHTNYFSTRYPFPVVVPSLIWSGVGFVELRERIIRWIQTKSFYFKVRAIHWVTASLLLSVCIPLLILALAPNRKDKIELKEIGSWLRNHGYAHSIIMGQREFKRLAFYADSDFIYLPAGSYENIVRFAKERKADLIVINKKTIDHSSPRFFEKISPGDLQRIDIPAIKTPKYATTVFITRGKGEGR